MFKSFQRKLIHSFIALLGCTYLSACNTTTTKQTEPPQTPAADPIADATPEVARPRVDPYARLNSKFLAKLKQVQDPDLRQEYLNGIHYLHRLAQEKPESREIFEKLIQHQEQTLDIFQICDGKETWTSFRWITLYHSQFWKRVDGSYLVLLICSTGTSNGRFVPFLYSENKGKATFKPLKLAQFWKKEDGTIQRVEPEVAAGRSFPDREQWFDPTTEELRIWTKLGGGAAPCDTKGTYRLQNDAFVLQEFTARFDCDTPREYEKLYP